jgi:hypothetical protein
MMGEGEKVWFADGEITLFVGTGRKYFTLSNSTLEQEGSVIDLPGEIIFLKRFKQLTVRICKTEDAKSKLTFHAIEGKQHRKIEKLISEFRDPTKVESSLRVQVFQTGQAKFVMFTLQDYVQSKHTRKLQRSSKRSKLHVPKLVFRLP